MYTDRRTGNGADPRVFSYDGLLLTTRLVTDVGRRDHRKRFSQFNADSGDDVSVTSLERVTLYDNTLYRQVVDDYLPPIFMLINYESAAFMRYLSPPPANRAAAAATDGEAFTNGAASSGTSDIRGNILTTDLVMTENESTVKKILDAANCGPREFQSCFLRFDSVGSLQTTFYKSYPLPSVTVGRLVRLDYGGNSAKRARALKVLLDNRAANCDVYSVHGATNRCMTTLTTVLEPIFYNAALQTLRQKRMKEGGGGAFVNERGSGGGGKSSSASSASSLPHSTKKTAMFEISLCLEDDDDDVDDDDDAVYYDSRGDGRSKTADAGVKKKGKNKRKVMVTTTNDGRNGYKNIPVTDGGGAEAEGPTTTLFEERRSRVGAGLTVHDVRRCVRAAAAPSPVGVAPTKRRAPGADYVLGRAAAVAVRFERYLICVSAALESVEHGGVVKALHVYYTWDPSLADRIRRTFCAATATDVVAAAGATAGSRTTTVEFLDRPAAVHRCLADLKLCFWTPDLGTYFRLALSTESDDKAYRRSIFTPLIERCNSQGNGAVRLQSFIDACRDDRNGVVDVFPNAMTLDCRRVRDELTDAAAFSKAYDAIMRDPSSVTVNGDVSPTDAKHMSHVHGLYEALVTSFKRDRVGVMCREMAAEMHVGILDAFGRRRCEHDDPDYRPRNHAELVENAFFISSLLDVSAHVSSSTHPSSLTRTTRGGRATTPKMPPPYVEAVEGVFHAIEDKGICEFDVESAYPTVIQHYNVSQENTAIVTRSELDEANSKVKWGFKGFDAAAGRWYHAVPYAGAGDDAANEEVMVVSLRKSIYVGVTARFMEELVLKRRTNARKQAFYKRFANTLYGCTARERSDAYAPHCTASTVSLFRALMCGVLKSLPVRVLYANTDGGLLQPVVPTTDLPREIRKRVQEYLLESSDDVKAAAGTHLVRVKTQLVDSCFVVRPNKYAVRYADGSFSCKGGGGGGGGGGKFGAHNAIIPVETESALGECLVDVISEDLSSSRLRSGGERSFEMDVDEDDDDEVTSPRCRAVIKKFLSRLADALRSRPLRWYHTQPDACYFFAVPPAAAADRYGVDLDAAFGFGRMDECVAVWPAIQEDGDFTSTFNTVTRLPDADSSLRRVDRFEALFAHIDLWLDDLCRVVCVDDYQPIALGGGKTTAGYKRTMAAILHECKLMPK